MKHYRLYHYKRLVDGTGEAKLEYRELPATARRSKSGSRKKKESPEIA